MRSEHATACEAARSSATVTVHRAPLRRHSPIAPCPSTRLLTAGACWHSTAPSGCWWWRRRRSMASPKPRCPCLSRWVLGAGRLPATRAAPACRRRGLNSSLLTAHLSTLQHFAGGAGAPRLLGRQHRVCQADHVCHRRGAGGAGGGHAAEPGWRLPGLCCRRRSAQVLQSGVNRWAVLQGSRCHLSLHATRWATRSRCACPPSCAQPLPFSPPPEQPMSGTWSSLTAGWC